MPSQPPTSFAPTPGSASQGERPTVSVSSAAVPFKIGPLIAARIDDAARSAARAAVEEYIHRLDWYRDGVSNLPLQGAFAQAVIGALGPAGDKPQPNKFALASVDLDRYLLKPWGTKALAEVRVTITDGPMDGSSARESETGRLRLMGDPLRVVDGWDDANARWYNGTPPRMTDADLQRGIREALIAHLWLETWSIGGQPGQWDPPTPFASGRAAYVRDLRSAFTSRAFAELSATIERYDTFAEISQGLATVKVVGTVITTAAQTTRAPFEQRFVVLFGNWSPEVVDAQLASGAWMSGGDLALVERDRNFA